MLKITIDKKKQSGFDNYSSLNQSLIIWRYFSIRYTNAHISFCSQLLQKLKMSQYDFNMSYV